MGTGEGQKPHVINLGDDEPPTKKSKGDSIAQANISKSEQEKVKPNMFAG